MQQSDRHSPRIDEELAKRSQSFTHGAPVESHQDGSRREDDGPFPGEPSAAAQPAERQPGASEGMTSGEVDLRSQLATYLDGSVFPATKQELLDDVRSNSAPPQVINLIEQLPEGETFDRTQSVWESITV